MRSLVQIVAVLLLTTTVAIGAGAMHVLSVAAPAPVAGCHHSRVPSNPPAPDYRCCVNGHRIALLNRIFSPCPTERVVKLSDALLTFADVGQRSAVPEASVHSSSSPPVVLRI